MAVERGPLLIRPNLSPVAQNNLVKRQFELGRNQSLVAERQIVKQVFNERQVDVDKFNTKDFRAKETMFADFFAVTF